MINNNNNNININNNTDFSIIGMISSTDNKLNKCITQEQISYMSNFFPFMDNYEKVLISQNRSFQNSGFHQYHDVLVELPQNDLIYSVNNNIYYKSFNDLLLLHNLQKYENNKTASQKDELGNIQLYPNITNIIGLKDLLLVEGENFNLLPSKWLAFLTVFFNMHCEDRKNYGVVVAYLITMLGTLIRQAPLIVNIGPVGSEDYLFISYNLGFNKIHKTNTIMFKHISMNSFPDDLDFNLDLNLKNLNFIIDNIFMQTTLVPNGYDFAKSLRVNLDKEVKPVDLVFTVPAKLFPIIMPLMFKFIIDSALRFPILFNNFDEVSEEFEQEYKDIVDKDFAKILYYILQFIPQVPIIYNNVLLNNLDKHLHT